MLARASLVAGALLLVSAAGCEFINSRSGLQCQSTSECRAKGPAFAGSICTNEGVCAALVAADASTNLSCQTSSDCTFLLGKPGRCINASCVALETDDGACSSIGPTGDDSAVVFGVLVPKNGEAGAQTAALEPVVNALLVDWNAVTATPPQPHFVGFVCDESNLTEALNLATAVHAQFLVGPFAETTLKAALAQNTDIPIFSPLGDSPSFETPPTTVRSWFCGPNRSKMVPPFLDAVKEVTAATATARSLANVKVVYAYDTAEPDEVDFFNATKAGLVFNGQPASSQPLYYAEQPIAFDLLTSPAVASQGYQIASAKPDVVLLSGSTWARTVIDAVEQRWSALNGAAPRPIYLMVRQNLAVASEVQSTSASINYDNRVFSVDIHQDPQGLANYQTYRARVALATVLSEPQGGAEYNDCLYSALLGVTAGAVSTSTAPTALSAFQIGQGVTSVSTGSSSNTGNLTAADLPKLLGLINSKVSTQLVGTKEVLGFDPTNGVANPGYEVFCIGSKGGPASEAWTSAGVVYDAQTQAPSGTLACP